MLLVDTSVWITHLRRGDPRLAQALMDARVLMHPFVLGEIACGNLHRRSTILSDLATLPQPVAAQHDEVLEFLERHRLFSRGIGWVDAHLLASAALTRCLLWTLDARLAAAAATVNLRLKNY